VKAIKQLGMAVTFMVTGTDELRLLNEATVTVGYTTESNQDDVM